MSERTRKYGRSLKLYLADGTPTGIITAELGNWSGKAVVAPRTALPDLIAREETSRTGVYILMGPDPDAADRTLVYVGEGDNIKTRLANHDKDDAKQFFTRICLIVATNDNLTKAHGRWLESRLIRAIRVAARAKLINGTEPDLKGLPESEIADMERFFSEIEILLPVLGFDVLRTAADTGGENQFDPTTDIVFTYTLAGANARAKEVGGEFVVLSGSVARVKETTHCPERTKANRKKLLDDGELALVPDSVGTLYRFTRDVAFGSPSAAASAVYGGGAGSGDWKEERTGRSYSEIREGRLRAAQEA